MTFFNRLKIVLAEQVASDPVSKHYESGHRLALRIMTLESPKNASKPQPSFHSVIAWDTAADDAERLLSKGSRVKVVGSLQYRNYKDDS